MGTIVQFRRPVSASTPAPWETDERAALSDAIETFKVAIGAVDELARRSSGPIRPTAYMAIRERMASQLACLERIMRETW